MSSLASLIRLGERRALAQGITLAADGNAAELLAELGPAQLPPVLGFTGAPGAGKSTLIGALTQSWVAAGLRVCILAVDPSSPVTGGALLGDRIRMAGLEDDERVYIRSLAARGHLGGLTEHFADVLQVVAAAGFDLVVVETVGVGQSEVEVMKFAKPVVVLVAPGQGDDVQAAKAGVLEIADLVVVTKSDLAGADRTLADLQHEDLPVIAVSSLQISGLTELLDRLA